MGIEPILTESQSVLLPLQHSHTKEVFGTLEETRTLTVSDLNAVRLPIAPQEQINRIELN